MARPTKFRGKWRVRWIDANGVRQSGGLFDDYKEAVAEQRRLEHEAHEIRKGLRTGILAEKTFNHLCDYWIEKRASQKRSGHHDESIIRKHLRPAFGPMRVKDIGTAQADEFVAARAQLDRKTVANHLTLLVSMLNVAVDLGWLLKVPRIRKPRVRLISADFRYLRTEEEMRRLLSAAADEGELVFTLYAAALYTGMRAGELAGLLWSDVDFDRRLITVQRSFDGPTKAADVRYVPILDPLLPVLRDWRLRHPGRLVFTNAAGKMFQPSASVFQEVLHRVLEKGAFPSVEHKGKARRYIVFHDLRHSFASHWVMRGGDLFKLQKILGHKTVQMTLRYAHLAPAAFAEDWSRFGSPVGGGNVVPLSSRGS